MVTFDDYRLCIADDEAKNANWSNIWRLGVVVFTRPEEIIQILVRQLKNGKDIDGVSNSRIMDGIKEGLKESFLSILPFGLSSCYSALEPFAVRDFT